jgi:hypothetical protein
MSPEDQDQIVSARAQPRHSDFSFVDFPQLPTVDGLISPAEQRYLYWLTSAMYAEEGSVVELGSWFGRSAMALGAGLRDSGRATTLHCFDRFRWNPQFAGSVTVADVKRLPDGGDFMPFFLANVSQVYPHVRATKTTIDQLDWDGGPIELLFIDAPKSFGDLTKTIFTFGPHLTVGRSLVILQDFFFTPAYPIALTVAAMSDAVRLVHTVTGASTAALVLESPLPTRIPDSWKYWEMSDEAVERLWRRLLAYIPEEQQSLLDPALAFYYLDRGKLDKARQHMSQIEFSTSGRNRLEFLRKSSAWGPRVEQMLERSDR